jgi:hypothetical protein
MEPIQFAVLFSALLCSLVAGLVFTFAMVVVIHGVFDTVKGMEKFSGFSHLANQENFVVLYPEGIGIFGYLQHWNAGHCCGKAANDKIDDVGYLADAIKNVCNRLSIDRNRIYMVGFFKRRHDDLSICCGTHGYARCSGPNRRQHRWPSRYGGASRAHPGTQKSAAHYAWLE